MRKKQPIEQLLSAFFEGSLNQQDTDNVIAWKRESNANLQLFNESQKAWEKIELLKRMKKYDADKALKEVHAKIDKRQKNGFLKTFQKIAAVLIVPMILATLYFSTRNTNQIISQNEWQTITTPPGSRSEFVLPDGTKVFLNSKTSMSYPIAFNGKVRNVILEGEAYFDVTENKKHPFIVNTGKIQIEVIGTEFKASNYGNEDLTEIVLVEGSVDLFAEEDEGRRNIIRTLKPGEKASYVESENKLYYGEVDVEKYISWKEGILMFRDDSMEEVVRRMNRWFNVDIKLSGKDLGDYVYTATFEDETLAQVLKLLQLSAPIDVKFNPRKRKDDGTFSKLEIEIIQK